MQIQSINSYNDKKNQPNFTAIKSLKMEGLYKKYPELGKQLVDTFQSSPRAMEFCKKYDESHYSGFQKFIDMGVGSEELKGNQELAALWIKYCDSYPE